jgi:hypothetical protein
MRRILAIFAGAALGLFATVAVRGQSMTAADPADLGSPSIAYAEPVDLGSSAAPSVNQVLESTLFDELGGFIITLPKGGFIWIFGNVTSFACTAACTLEVGAMVEVGNNKAAANRWVICPLVDKSSTKLFCPTQGTLPTDQGHVVGNFAWSVLLTKGTHTVQPAVFVAAPAAIFDYHFTYRAYQP